MKLTAISTSVAAAAATVMALSFIAACPETEENGSDGGAQGGCALVPCGGNLEGTWSFASGCRTYPAGTTFSNTVCPQATLTALSILGSQTVVLAGGTFTSVTTGLTSTATVALPSACVETGAVSCTGTASALEGALSGTDVACTGNAEAGCACSISSQGAALQTSGSYTVLGNLVTLTAGGADSIFDYCVQGATLTLRSSDGTVTIYGRR
jgi:hypothetical protein